jgi:hypothetical protein
MKEKTAMQVKRKDLQEVKEEGVKISFFVAVGSDRVSFR